MEPERATDGDPPGRGATSERAVDPDVAADPGPEHDDTTSREAFEREMAEQGRSDEAARYGDHIE